MSPRERIEATSSALSSLLRAAEEYAAEYDRGDDFDHLDIEALGERGREVHDAARAPTLAAEVAEIREALDLIKDVLAGWPEARATRMLVDDHLNSLDHKDEMELGELILTVHEAQRKILALLGEAGT